MLVHANIMNMYALSMRIKHAHMHVPVYYVLLSTTHTTTHCCENAVICHLKAGHQHFWSLAIAAQTDPRDLLWRVPACSMTDKRVDPVTGKALTYNELVATYKKTYQRQEINKYWLALKPAIWRKKAGQVRWPILVCCDLERSALDVVGQVCRATCSL